MEDKLIEILQSFGYPVIRQGSLPPQQEYPEHFFTFWNNDTPAHSHYNNDEYGFEHEFYVYFYSTDPEKTYSELENARVALKKSGFISHGKGFDVVSDEPTHTGRGMTVTYLET